MFGAVSVPAYWCEHAWLGDGDHTTAEVLLTVSEGRITTVATGVGPPPAGTVRLAGLTLPGIANGHSHAFHRALRGRTHGAGGSFWSWREQMYTLAVRLDPDTYRALATAVFAEMVSCGYTCVGEFHYLHHDPYGRPYADPNAMGRALLDAADTAGMRITLLDTCYLHGGIGQPLNEVQQRFSDGSAAAWAERRGALGARPGVRIGAAIHSVRAVDPPSMEAVAAAAGSDPLHAHVSEQPAENEQCLVQHGCTPTALLARHDVLGPSFTAVHATHLDAADVDAFERSGAGVCLCPTTERDLADGIAPTAELAAAGIWWSIGSDSHAVIDPFEETRAVELDERLASLRLGTHQPGSLMHSATVTGYRSLGWPDGGRLAAGALADFVTVGLDSPRLAGAPTPALVAAAVFAATAADVHHVVVAGRVVVEDGRHRRLDVAAELQRTIAAMWDE
jgi:formiminoglutamate deiminase